MGLKTNELRIGSYMGYFVREDGLILNRHNKIIKQVLNDKGYPSVSLSNKGKPVFRRVHRIVAELFIDNPENKPNVNHKDRDRLNCNVDNLEWCTQKENIIHSVKNGGRKGFTRNNTGEKNPNSKYTWLHILAIRDLYNSCGYSQNKLAKIFNSSQGTIAKIVNNQVWKSKE